MPYNTRRKSLSLPSLGIQLPQSSKSQQSPLTSAKSEQPPSKKLKRDFSPVASVAYQPGCCDPTPPPSPPPENRINYDGINDEIVSGVIDVLERTGNRPHTVKELAAVLSSLLNIVENSANPHAIISSRLNSYLKRGSPASSPCSLAKELITTHPRRIYFYLTTCSRQPIPLHENVIVTSRRAAASPALSDDEENRRRMEMSPSPEVDLSSHELDDETGPPSPEETGSALSATSSASIIARERTGSPASLDRKSALSSPPLEGDEREFSQSAIYIETRSVSREVEQKKASEASPKRTREEFEADGNEDRTIENTSNDAAAMLLGYGSSGSNASVFSSPIIKPSTIHPITPRVRHENSLDTDGAEKHHQSQEKPHEDSDIPTGIGLGNWGGEFERHLGSPENVELDELDDLLDF